MRSLRSLNSVLLLLHFTQYASVGRIQQSLFYVLSSAVWNDRAKPHQIYEGGKCPHCGVARTSAETETSINNCRIFQLGGCRGVAGSHRCFIKVFISFPQLRVQRLSCVCVQHGRHPHRLQRALRSQRRTQLSVGGFPGAHPVSKARNCEFTSRLSIHSFIHWLF